MCTLCGCPHISCQAQLVLGCYLPEHPNLLHGVAKCLFLPWQVVLPLHQALQAGDGCGDRIVTHHPIWERSKGFCFPLLFPEAILPCYGKGCSRVPHLPLPLAWCTELVHWCLGGDEWTKCCMGIDFSELMLQGLTNCLRRSHRPNPSSKSLEIQTNKTKLFML